MVSPVQGRVSFARLITPTEPDPLWLWKGMSPEDAKDMHSNQHGLVRTLKRESFMTTPTHREVVSPPPREWDPVGRSHAGPGGSEATEIDDQHGIPPVFYRDGPPALPPPDDPHWRDWPQGSAYEPAPRWLLSVLVGVIMAIIIVHILFIFILLR